MKFVFDDSATKSKFAWFPVCVCEEEKKTVWIWFERYTERVERRYGIGGVTYYRESKHGNGMVTGWVG